MKGNHMQTKIITAVILAAVLTGCITMPTSDNVPARPLLEIGADIIQVAQAIHGDAERLVAAKDAQDWHNVARYGVRIAINLARINQLIDEARDAIKI